ncbi:hypothetical protein F5X68DRAFT_268761 [Plectosphaerella plurivora]|uniref:Uncharacterized protein n=1 Tax=Plectosphaerella plurivora TaxID=936078 RepID=A0A9P8VBZ8_9PEZI|nr:hypothetical protein F5X68DRAFT_268761 [Plectosphaerella plurivora]
MTTEIYTGQWTDWSRGRVLGATLTLSSRDGAILVAFLAFFVTIVGTRTWIIVSFVAHQIMAKDSPHDGLHYQRQHILRNESAAGATWLFLQQSWYWRKTIPKVWQRTLPWALGAALFVGLFAAASILSGFITDGASEYRLLMSDDCGLQEPRDIEALQVLKAFENQQAATYTRQCYDNDAPSGSCNDLPIRTLEWTNGTRTCPFDPTICLPDVRPFHMKTKELNSHHDFGINEPPENRVGYRRETLCTPLVTAHQNVNVSFMERIPAVRNSTDESVTWVYLYGRRQGSQGRLTTPYTHAYNSENFNGDMAYSVWALRHIPSSASSWVPIDALKPNVPADTTIMFIVPNSIKHIDPNNDPIFGANITWDQPGQIQRMYRPDRAVSPIACIDLHQICNLDPKAYKCNTPQSGRTVGDREGLAGLNLNPIQYATAMRLAWLTKFQSFYDVTFTRTNGFLRAQDRVNGIAQHRLPDDQWKIEMGALFSDSLSLMQHQVMRYPTGPARPGNITMLKLWIPDDILERSITDPDPSPFDLATNKAFETMCHTQKVKFTNGTLNFSVLGLGLLLGIGLLLIIVSYIVQPIVASRQKKSPTGAVKAGHWDRDDALQVLRRLLEAMGAGDWEGVMAEFPRTRTACKFEYEPVTREQETTPTETTPTQVSGEETSQMAMASPGIRRKPVAVVSEAGV